MIASCLPLPPLPSLIHALAGVGAPPPIPRWSPDRPPADRHMEDPSVPATPARRCPAVDDPAFFDSLQEDPSEPQDECPVAARRVLN